MDEETKIIPSKKYYQNNLPYQQLRNNLQIQPSRNTIKKIIIQQQYIKNISTVIKNLINQVIQQYQLHQNLQFHSKYKQQQLINSLLLYSNSAFKQPYQYQLVEQIYTYCSYGNSFHIFLKTIFHHPSPQLQKIWSKLLKSQLQCISMNSSRQQSSFQKINILLYLYNFQLTINNDHLICVQQCINLCYKQITQFSINCIKPHIILSMFIQCINILQKFIISQNTKSLIQLCYYIFITKKNYINILPQYLLSMIQCLLQNNFKFIVLKQNDYTTINFLTIVEIYNSDMLSKWLTIINQLQFLLPIELYKKCHNCLQQYLSQNKNQSIINLITKPLNVSLITAIAQYCMTKILEEEGYRNCRLLCDKQFITLMKNDKLLMIKLELYLHQQLRKIVIHYITHPKMIIGILQLYCSYNSLILQQSQHNYLKQQILHFMNNNYPQLITQQFLSVNNMQFIKNDRYSNPITYQPTKISLTLDNKKLFNPTDGNLSPNKSLQILQLAYRSPSQFLKCIDFHPKSSIYIQIYNQMLTNAIISANYRPLIHQNILSYLAANLQQLVTNFNHQQRLIFIQNIISITLQSLYAHIHIPIILLSIKSTNLIHCSLISNNLIQRWFQQMLRYAHLYHTNIYYQMTIVNIMIIISYPQQFTYCNSNKNIITQQVKQFLIQSMVNLSEKILKIKPQQTNKVKNYQITTRIFLNTAMIAIQHMQQSQQLQYVWHNINNYIQQQITTTKRIHLQLNQNKQPFKRQLKHQLQEYNKEIEEQIQFKVPLQNNGIIQYCEQQLISIDQVQQWCNRSAIINNKYNKINNNKNIYARINGQQIRVILSIIPNAQQQ